MPRHRNTVLVPTVLSIVVMVLLTALAGTATAYLVIGPVFGPREAVGFTLGVLASGMLGVHTILRMWTREELKRPDVEPPAPGQGYLQGVDLDSTAVLRTDHRTYEQATARFAARYPR